MSHCKHLNSSIVHFTHNAIKAHCVDCGLTTTTSEEVPPKWICRLLRRWVLKTFFENHVHLSSDGRDPDEVRYSKRDVEALVAIGIAASKMKSSSNPTDSPHK